MFYRRDHPLPILLGHAGAGRQAEALGEEAFTDGAAVRLDPGEDRLQVERFPQRARLDVGRLESQPHVLAIAAGDRGIDGQAGQPARDHRL